MAAQLTPDESAALRHWSIYGQKGEPPSDRVKASDRTTSPINAPVTSSWNQVVPRSQLPKLLNGFKPSAMEDKWFVYVEGPDRHGMAMVHMARSWTGHMMADVKLEFPPDDAADAKFTQVAWEADKERHRTQTEEGAKKMVREVCGWCMDVILP